MARESEKAMLQVQWEDLLLGRVGTYDVPQNRASVPNYVRPIPHRSRQDLRERLGVYVTIVKKTEDERDSLRDKLAQAGQQSERDVAALQARIDKLEG